MVQTGRNKPSKPGHVWVEDKSVKAGGYFRKLPPGAKVAPESKDGEGPKGDLKGALTKVALGVGGVLVGGYIVKKTGEAVNDAVIKASIKEAYESGEFNDGEFNDLKRLMADFSPGYEKEMNKWQRRDSYDMAPTEKGLAATTAGLLAVSAEYGTNPKSEKGTASGVGDVTGLGYRDSPGIRAEKKKEDSSDRNDRAERTGVPTKPGHTWVEDRTVKGGGYFRKLAAGETAKGSKPPQSAGGGVAAKIGLGSLAALAATGLAAAATSKQQKPQEEEGSPILGISGKVGAVVAGLAVAKTSVGVGLTVAGGIAMEKNRKSIHDIMEEKRKEAEDIERKEQEEEAELRGRIRYVDKEAIAKQEASVGAIPKPASKAEDDTGWVKEARVRISQAAKMGAEIGRQAEGARKGEIDRERQAIWKDTPGPSKDQPKSVIPPAPQRALPPARDRNQPEPINTNPPKGAKLTEELEKYNAARKAQGNTPITFTGRDNPGTTSVTRRPAPVIGTADKPLDGEKLRAKKDRQAETKLKTLNAELEQYNQARKAQGQESITLTGREGAGFSPQEGKVKQSGLDALVNNPARQERMKKLKDELTSPPSAEDLAAKRKYEEEIAAQPNRISQVIGEPGKKQEKGSLFGGITTPERSARISKLKDMFQ